MTKQMGHSHEGYSINLPYPRVTPGRNLYIVSLLLEDYSGIISELTAITQYVYASIQLSGSNKKASDTLMSIAITEMHHLELLAEAIIAKGGDPKYVMCGGTKPEQFWNAEVVEYGKGLCNILKQSIASEEAAIAQYKRHIKYIEDESVDALLRRIIMDEELHLKTFTDLYNQCQGKR